MNNVTRRAPGARHGRPSAPLCQLRPRVRAGSFGPPAVVLLALLLAGAVGLRAWVLDETSFLTHVRFLSSNQLEGRGNGTPGLERAAEYIADAFSAAGLEPAGDDGTWFQSFEVEVRREPLSADVLAISNGAGETRFRLGREYHPLSILDRRETGALDELVDLPVVFAGYGISAPGLGYDDYAGLDVRDAAVVVFTDEPQEDDESSVFAGRGLTPHATILSKAQVAASRGARLLLVVEDPSDVTDRAITPNWRRDPRIDTFALPVVRVEHRAMDALLPVDFEHAARAIDLTLTPQSRVFDTVRVRYTERYAEIRPVVRNVVGVLRGRHSEVGREAVVVGGHYDHLGRGGPFSRAIVPYGLIHNGADDNASGIAAIIEMARAASAEPEQFGRSLVFVAFAAEELGLLGSKHYVDHPAVPLDRTLAMINLDMVGRAHGRVMVGGLELSPVFQQSIDSVRPLTTLRLEDFSEGYEDGRSDNWPFIHHGIPAMSFFTGFHRDYHRPTDNWEDIDAAGGIEIARIALELAARLASPAIR